MSKSAILPFVVSGLVVAVLTPLLLSTDYGPIAWWNAAGPELRWKAAIGIAVALLAALGLAATATAARKAEAGLGQPAGGLLALPRLIVAPRRVVEARSPEAVIADLEAMVGLAPVKREVNAPDRAAGAGAAAARRGPAGGGDQPAHGVHRAARRRQDRGGAGDR